MRLPSFGHRPEMTWRTVKGHVHCAIVFGVDLLALTLKSPSVIRRKDTADKSNDAQRILAVVAQGVYVPPKVAASRYGLVEPRYAITVSAANRPERAAMGTPGPGWTLPPARKRPGTRLVEEGRRNGVIQP